MEDLIVHKSRQSLLKSLQVQDGYEQDTSQMIGNFGAEEQMIGNFGAEE